MDHINTKTHDIIFVILIFALNCQILLDMVGKSLGEIFLNLLFLLIPLLISFYLNLSKLPKNSILLIYILLSALISNLILKTFQTFSILLPISSRFFGENGFSSNSIILLCILGLLLLSYLLSNNLNILFSSIKFVIVIAAITFAIIFLLHGQFDFTNFESRFTDSNKGSLNLFNSISIIAYLSFFNLTEFLDKNLSLKKIRYSLIGVLIFWGVIPSIFSIIKWNKYWLFFDKPFIVLVNIFQLFLILIALSIIVRQLRENVNKARFRLSLYILPFIIGVVIFSLGYRLLGDKLQILQFSVQIFIILVLFLRNIYISISNYFPSFKKISLLALSSFPLYFLIKRSFFDFPLFNRSSNDFIFVFTKVALFFSVLTFIYYSVETLLLWYAYGTKSYTSNLKDVEIATDYHIVVLIPCMNEELVIKNTVRSLLDTKYKNLEIYVIDDASEDDTRKELEEFQGDSRFQLLRRTKPNAQKGKGEALNWAYQKVVDKYLKNKGIFENTLITIIDADSSVESDYFDKVNLVFNSDFELTGLQSKVKIINKDNNTAQDLEFREIINATQSLRSKTNTVAFGGNGQFCKLSTLYSLHEAPWTNSLVEDFDLSLRIFLSDIYNVRNVQYDDIMIKQTGIYGDNSALVKQRVRWAQGNIQSLKYFVKIVQSPNLRIIQKLEIVSTLIKPWLMAIEYLVVLYTGLVIFGTIILNGITPTVIVFIVTFLAMLLYIFLINIVWATLYNRNHQKKHQTKFNLQKVLRDAFYLTKFLVLLTQIYPQATIRYFTAQNSWDKTKRQV